MFLLGADHHTNHVSSYPFKSNERIISKLMSLDFSLISKEAADKCLEELYLEEEGIL